MTRALWVFAALLVGCPDTDHRPPDDASDTSVPESGSSDTSTDAEGGRDAQTPDASIDTGPRDCSEIGDLRRCDRCPDRCPVGQTCLAMIGVCAPRDSDACDMSAFPGGGSACRSGSPCAGTQRDDTFNGLCVDPAFCLDAQDAGLPFESCRYADSTPVVTGPPDATCPPSSDPRAPFCGGACGGVTCPPADLLGMSVETPCLGFSDTRGFGVCALAVVFCHPGYAYDRNCDENYGESCACMVLQPQPDLPADAPRPVGYFVVGSSCLAYREQHPETVECFDRNWQPLEGL
ncbi:MAG: hypothetical protein IT379_11990 [Deltaproteobacteria bacterium]|nr:hypothetical protein [Deltaproteobacteria bacterium]